VRSMPGSLDGSYLHLQELSVSRASERFIQMSHLADLRYLQLADLMMSYGSVSRKRYAPCVPQEKKKCVA
jgi:hypothetical protein